MIALKTSLDAFKMITSDMVCLYAIYNFRDNVYFASNIPSFLINNAVSNVLNNVFPRCIPLSVK